MTVEDSQVGVLIVDDQAPFRRAAGAVVRMTPGFEVAGEASSGEEAIDQVDATQADFVLMDINMTGMTGIEATRRILERSPDVVVLILSTYANEDVPAEVHTSGAAGYVNKEDFGPQVLRDIWAQRSAAHGDAP